MKMTRGIKRWSILIISSTAAGLGMSVRDLSGDEMSFSRPSARYCSCVKDGRPPETAALFGLCVVSSPFSSYLHIF